MSTNNTYFKIYKKHWFTPHEWLLKEEGGVTERRKSIGFFRLFECIKCGKIKLIKTNE